MKTIVYSKENCPACIALKEKLNKEGEDFIEIKVGADISREEFMQKFPQVRSMPHMVVEA